MRYRIPVKSKSGGDAGSDHISLSLSLSLPSYTDITYWIFQKIDKSSIQFPDAAKDDSALDHEVRGGDEHSKDSSGEVLVGEVAYPQRGRGKSPIKL